jgi:hypothetical protein
MNTIEERLSLLERSLRRYRIAAVTFGVAILGAGMVGFTGDGIQDTVRTRAFELVGPTGRPVVVMGYDGDERVLGSGRADDSYIRMMDGQGRQGVVIRAQADKGGLVSVMNGAAFKWLEPEDISSKPRRKK